MPEDVYHDIAEICRFSPTPVSIKGDIRMPGEHYAERLLSLLQHKPVANSLVFELNYAASAFFIQEIARAAPGFRLSIAPGSPDEVVRQRLRHSYSNKEIESTIEAALRSRAGSVDVLFLIGLPGQSVQSVVETIVYCEYLLRRFDGDRRLCLQIAPCLLPGDSSFGSFESYGFKPRFHAFEEYLNSVSSPAWEDRLEYQTEEMSVEQIAASTYDALIRLTRLKAKYGQLPYKKAEDIAANYAKGWELTKRLEEIIKGGHTDELASLKTEIDQTNNCNAGFHRERSVPLMLARPQNLLALCKAWLNNSPWQH
jgi:hypothetical protein